jgi:hypothetical protein
MIDTYAGEPQFADHLLPVYQAMTRPGDFIISRPLSERGPTRWPPATAQLVDPSRPILVASYGDVKKARRQGRTRIARIEHGAGQSYGTAHGSYAGGRDNEDVSLFLMPNEYSAALWRKAYPKAQVEIIGSPKLDSLPAKDPIQPPTVCISFHWDCYLVPETVSAFSHYRHVLPELAKTYNLIGHGHPKAHPILERRYRRLGIPFVRDFADVCRQADLYICDNSSSLYEFAATGRPVVTLNQPMYRKDVHHGLRFWDAIPGLMVDDPGQLIEAVGCALADAPHLATAREDALSVVYAYRFGAAQRAAQALAAWAA